MLGELTYVTHSQVQHAGIADEARGSLVKRPACNLCLFAKRPFVAGYMAETSLKHSAEGSLLGKG